MAERVAAEGGAAPPGATKKEASRRSLSFLAVDVSTD